ncbi:MAG TPA: transglycosylase SLT domain-containing protein [Elusimicrobiota bacterium]|nr:transglycosylase SLT domain-containing protein [Elusimicrobiota bacterium]
MKRLALAFAVAGVFATGCDDKDKGSVPAQAPAYQRAQAASSTPAGASLMSFAGGSESGAAASEGDPGRLQFDGEALGYAEPGGGAVYAGAPRAYAPRSPIQYTSFEPNVPTDLQLAAPPTPFVGGAESYSSLRSALINRGSDARAIDEMINQSLRKGLDPLMTLAIGSQESGLRNRITSPVGARGAMQLMPATACGLGVCNSAALYNPTVNVGLGTTYFQSMLSKFGRVDLALAAYNAGPGAVEKYGGVPPYRETQGYVRNVLGYYRRFRSFLSETVSA